MIDIIPIETPSLGDRSYLVHDGDVAFVIDPQRDIDRVLALLESQDVRLLHVFETHIHNDYVTGGLALSRLVGAEYHLNGADDVSFDRIPIDDGDIVHIGSSMVLRAVATPGHTFTHLSYVLMVEDQPRAVFTGGSLLYGATGRPDLLGPAHTSELAHAQCTSAHRLAEQLPDDVDIYPTHGFGSFCASTQAEATASTIGNEKRTNPVLTESEQSYVDSLLAGLDAYPAYYAHMAPMNASGPPGPDLSAPRPANAAELRGRITAGEWVVDLRHRSAYAAGHLAGGMNFGIDGNFATYLGWLIPWGTPLSLIGDSAEQVGEAQRELVRIGIDRLESAAAGGWSDGEGMRTFDTATFFELAQVRHHRPVVVLDVRRSQERAQARIEDTVHIPLHELLDRLTEVPVGEVWVHCRSGYRASIAASVLDAAGRRVIAIDDEFDRAGVVGLPVVRGSEVPA